MIIDAILNAVMIALDAVPVIADRRRRAFADTHIATGHRFSLGVETRTRTHYLSIPVSNPAAEDEEYYRLTRAEYDDFTEDIDAASAFAEECRARRHDDRLVVRPGRNRGTPR